MFTGIGGFDLAMRNLGHAKVQVLWQRGHRSGGAVDRESLWISKRFSLDLAISTPVINHSIFSI